MAKFCGKCGSRLDLETGSCPNCDREKIQALQKISRKRSGTGMKNLLIAIMCIVLISAVLLTGVILVRRLRQHAKKAPEESGQAAQSSGKYEQMEEPSQETAEIVTDEYFDDSYTGLDIPYNPDSIGTYYFHIPRVNLDIPGIEEINERIFNDLYYGVMMESVYSMGEPHMSKMAYTYCEKGDILSILVCAYDRYTAEYGDYYQYWVYNISKTTGTLIPDEEVIASFGITPETYNTLVRNALQEESWDQYEHNGMMIKPGESAYMDAYYQGCLQKTLSAENLVMPYIDAANGDLCIAASIYVIYGDGKEQFSFNLTGTSEPIDPAEYRDITHRWGKSQTVWDELTVSEFYKIRDLLRVPQYSSLTFDVGTPYYRDGCSQWLRHINIGIDGKEVAGASVGVSPCQLYTEIMMYTPESEFPYIRYEKRDEPIWLIEGTWILDAEEKREAPQKLTFRNDGTVELVYADGSTETLSYREDNINTSLFIGTEKYLYSVWPGTENLYLFPDGQKVNPIIYSLQY